MRIILYLISHFVEYIFIICQNIPLKLSNSTSFKVLLAAVLTDFCQLVHVKSWKKKAEGAIFPCKIMNKNNIKFI